MAARLEQLGTRDQILSVALDLFAQHGFAATSVRQIAAAAGLRPSSLYNHFASKEAIFHALTDAHGPASSADRLASPRCRALWDDVHLAVDSGLMGM